MSEPEKLETKEMHCLMGNIENWQISEDYKGVNKEPKIEKKNN